MDDNIQINEEEKKDKEEKEIEKLENKEIIVENKEDNKNEKTDEGKLEDKKEEIIEDKTEEDNSVIEEKKEDKNDEKAEIDTNIKNDNIENDKIDENEDKTKAETQTESQNRVIIIPIGKIIFVILGLIIIMLIFSNLPKIFPDKKIINIDEEINIEYSEAGAFLFEISENGKGEYAKGKIVRGTVKVGDEIQLIGLDEESVLLKVTEIYIDNANEKHKNVKSAKIGENAEIHFKIDKDKIKIGKVLAKKDTIKTSKKIEVNMSPTEYVEKNEIEKKIENGKTYNFYIRQINSKGIIELERNSISISKDNKNFKVVINLEKSVAVDKNTKFYLVEGGRKLIECTVTKVD